MHWASPDRVWPLENLCEALSLDPSRFGRSYKRTDRMTAQLHQPNPCENMNHRRENAPVGHCPQCGGIVNPDIPVAACSEAEHALARRQQSMFCVHCGLLLIASR